MNKDIFELIFLQLHNHIRKYRNMEYKKNFKSSSHNDTILYLPSVSWLNKRLLNNREYVYSVIFNFRKNIYVLNHKLPQNY